MCRKVCCVEMKTEDTPPPQKCYYFVLVMSFGARICTVVMMEG